MTTARNLDAGEQEAARRVAQVIGGSALSQAELARQIGTSESHLSRVKTGKIGLSKRMARKLERVLPVSAVWLLYGEEAEGVAEAPPGAPQPSTGSSAVDPPGAYRVPPVVKQVYCCGHCNGEVAPGQPNCPHCGGQLAWSELGQRPADKSPSA